MAWVYMATALARTSSPTAMLIIISSKLKPAPGWRIVLRIVGPSSAILRDQARHRVSLGDVAILRRRVLHVHRDLAQRVVRIPGADENLALEIVQGQVSVVARSQNAVGTGLLITLAGTGAGGVGHIAGHVIGGAVESVGAGRIDGLIAVEEGAAGRGLCALGPGHYART